MAIAASSLAPQAAIAGAPLHAFAGGAAGSSGPGFSFHDFLSIINPLQHIPIVSTLYRAFTGDAIKPLERVAGDTLYGGWIGLASSVANLVFEKETGKDFGDTVLAFLSGDKDSKPAAIAAGGQAVPASVVAATPITPQTALPAHDESVAALASSLTGDHIDADLGQRAIYAYRRSMGMSGAPIDPVPAF